MLANGLQFERCTRCGITESFYRGEGLDYICRGCQLKQEKAELAAERVSDQ